MVRLSTVRWLLLELANLPVTASRESCHTPPTGITCRSADTLAPVHLWFLVTPEGKLRAKELTACLPFNRQDFPSVSLTLNFYSFCLFSLEPLAVFFQPVSSCSFLAISLAPGDFVYSFCYPWPGCHSTDLWKWSVLDSLVGVAASAAEGSWLHSGLWQQHPSRLLLFIQAIAGFHVPRLTVLQPVFNIFLCLVICSPSCVMNLSPYCPLGHVGLPEKVGSCFIIYGSCPAMVSSNRVTSV